MCKFCGQLSGMDISEDKWDPGKKDLPERSSHAQNHQELHTSQLKLEDKVHVGFLHEPISQCWVFGGGTKLTVLGK